MGVQQHGDAATTAVVKEMATTAAASLAAASRVAVTWVAVLVLAATSAVVVK